MRAIRIINRRKSLFLYILLHAGASLERKGVDRQTIGGELLYLLQSPADILFRLLRKAQNDIHIDIVKARLPAEDKGLPDLLHRMPASDQAESLLIHGLGIDTDPGHMMCMDHAQLIRGDTVRPAGLDGKFLNAFHGKASFQHGKKTFQLRGLQGRRCAAADIDGIQDAAAHHGR